MTEKILCVDDDSNILQAYQRALRKQLHIEPALGGAEALEAIANRGPYAVVVADMQMPGMNGVELLARVKEVSPDTVRMMLTGNADQQTALEAVNEGHIFRFMTKPCSPVHFSKALEAGIAQYRLITAERELLSKTLSGAIKMLSEVLSLTNPMAFGRASRIRQLAHKLIEQLGLKQAWQIEVAAMLSQVGCVAIDEDTLAKVQRGEPLSSTETEDYRAHPLVARELVANIPRLDQIAEIIAHQECRFDGQGASTESLQGENIPLGGRILKVALDFDNLISVGYSNETAMAEMQHRRGVYDPSLVAALSKILVIIDAQVICRARMSKFRQGMILAEDIKTSGGTLLCARGQEVTRAMRIRLRNYERNIGVNAGFKVFVPQEMAIQLAKEKSAEDEANMLTAKTSL